MSLQAAKFKANSSKHFALSYKYRQEKEAAFLLQIDALIAQANATDAEEEAAYLDKRGDELPEELKFKQQRLDTVKAVLAALEALELANHDLHTVEDIEDKAQISFADFDARIMGKNGQFDYSYNGQHASCAYTKSSLVNTPVNVPMTNKK